MPTKLALLDAEIAQYELKVAELKDELTRAKVILDALHIASFEEKEKQEGRGEEKL